MGAFYCDSSALVKRYAHETGTLWVRSLTDPQAGHDIFTAHITGIEVVAAIARKTRLREIAAPDATMAIRTFKRHFTTQYQIVLMTTGLVDRAMELAEKHGLRIAFILVLSVPPADICHAQPGMPPTDDSTRSSPPRLLPPATLKTIFPS
jgi:predicted nucleic acid-binding protein